MNLVAVTTSDRDNLLDMATIYWKEIMPYSYVVGDAARRDEYFASEFAGANKHVFWGVSGDKRVGFVSYEVDEEKRSARICNIYISNACRRKRYGTDIVRLVVKCLDSLGIEQIDLNVRRDNPNALAFWEAQGFGIAGYRLRMYRDPEKGIAFTGSLSSDFEKLRP